MEMAQSPQPQATLLKVGDLVLDALTGKVERGGRPIYLTTKEYALVEYLMRHAGDVITRTMLSENVWNVHCDLLTNIIDVYINYVRSKIDHGHKTKLIHTVRGIGYLMKA